MTDRAEIERLLNATGRTLEWLPEDYGDKKLELWNSFRDKTFGHIKSFDMANRILHQSDMIELLVGALMDALEKRDAALEKVPKWISVEERLPKNEEVVIIAGWRKGISGKLWHVVMTAFHVDGEMYAQDSMYTWSDGNIELKYDEDKDDFIVPEGWFEDVQCADEFSMVDGIEVTHWMPLPDAPEEEE